ncbi:MAG TPA: sigma-70 family RNA polymerase sigma factor [Bacteroidota bacterium]|nr:sigma-70 family RNA polymerase sigma factor [Bacteroidota bacterium]
MTHDDELDLVERFQAGDEQAFNTLTLRYQEKIYWVVRRMIPDHDEADDVVQDVFIRAYHSLKSFKGESSVYTWLYRIAVNLSLNEIRRRKIRKTFSLDENTTEQHRSYEDSPVEEIEKQEQAALIRQAIDRLPEKQKKVFILRYYEEMPYEEIAKIVRTSVGGLKANYFHAVKKIGEFLKHEMP